MISVTLIRYFLYTRTFVGQLYTKRTIRKARIAYPDQHSQTRTLSYGGSSQCPPIYRGISPDMSVTIVPVMEDNLSYILRRGNDCLLVDVGDAGPVLASLNQGESPLAVLATHHHWYSPISIVVKSTLIQGSHFR